MFTGKLSLLCVLVFLIVFTGFAYAQNKTPEIRFAETPPGIDGKAGDLAWADADVLTGFTLPESMLPASDQSEARILFDDENIYFHLRAHESHAALISREANVFRSDSFEVFIQPEPGTDVYYQIAVSVSGGIYTGRMLGEWSPDVEVSISEADDYWALKMAVPLSELGMPAPEEDREIRFNIIRNDWADPGREREHRPVYSSFSLLDVVNFHVPELWSKAVMTRKPGEPRKIVNEPPHRNLFENPDFSTARNNYPEGWSIPALYWEKGDVERRETMPMSGEWVIAAKGSAYVILNKPVELEPGETYTVRFRARRFGEAAFGIHQRLKDGSTRRVVWDVSPTQDFRYYHADFTAREDAVGLIFYRIGPRTEADGLEISSIELFEGRLSPFEIRRYVPRGLSAKVEGSAREIAHNFYGNSSSAGKLRVLAVSYTLFSSREYLHLFSGLDVEADILIVTGVNQDTYYTESDPDLVKRRIENGEYDLYAVGRVAVLRVGEELADRIFKNVEKGAGLLIHPFPGRNDVGGNFTRIMDEYGAKKIEPGHYLERGLPLEMYPQGNPVKGIHEAEAGAGRIVVVDIDNTSWNLQIRIPRDMLTYFTFPHDRYSNAWLARMLYYAAGGAADYIKNAAYLDGTARVELSGADGASRLRWQLDDKNGNLVSRGWEDAAASAIVFRLPKTSVAGHHILSLWLEDKNGAVMDYSTLAFRHEGPEIAEFNSVKEFYNKDENGKFSLRIAGAARPMRVDWELEDFSGRVLESGSLKASENLVFTVPLENIYTNLARLWVYLREGDRTLDARRFAVYMPDRDRERLLNDFNVAVWPEGTTNPDGAPYINRVLEEIGVRVKNHSWHTLSFNDGLGSTTNLQGAGGRHFWGSGSHRDNIRQPSLRDPAILRELEQGVKKQAEYDRGYGPLAVQVVDEPSLTGYTGSAIVEIDAHPESLRVYRERMKEKYGTIGRFNERCSTNYSSFDEIGLVLTSDARTRENYAEFIEWRNYMVDTWVEAFSLASGSYHSRYPGVPVAMQNSFGQTALNGNDYWKLLTRAGFGFSNEYTDMVHNTPMRGFAELYRSFRPDMRVWGYIGYSFNREAATFKPWWFALHRFGGFTFYSAAGAVPGSQDWNLVSVPGFGMTDRGALLREGIEELLRGPGRLFLEYDWHERDIAVLYSQPSMLVSWCRGTENTKFGLDRASPYHDYFHSRHGIRYMLEELLYQYDFVSTEQVDGGILDNYKVLFMPHIKALSNENAERITEFLNRGGVVISDIVPAGYDELGTPRVDFPFEGSGGRLIILGGVFNDSDISQRRKVLGFLQAAGARPVLICSDAVETPGREAMHFADGDMNVYAITRDYRRSSDEKTQTFVFPTGKMHLYDLREGKYLGETDRVSCAIPNAGTKVYGHYPYRAEGIEVDVPDRLPAGSDLAADIRLITSSGEAGRHIFHIEVIPPGGGARWFMKRNAPAGNGRYLFNFRMAENDPEGNWTLRVTDVMTGAVQEESFLLYN